MRISDWSSDVCSSDLLASVKMLPIIACLVWFWFDGSGDLRRRRAVLDGLLGGLAALMVSRLVQVLSPHRPRPGLSREFDFVQPIGGYVTHWSSFPHAPETGQASCRARGCTAGLNT